MNIACSGIQLVYAAYCILVADMLVGVGVNACSCTNNCAKNSADIDRSVLEWHWLSFF